LYDEELLKLFQAFNIHQLEYIMVGGFATNIHGFSRIRQIWMFG
jgi:hypothetical protein